MTQPARENITKTRRVTSASGKYNIQTPGGLLKNPGDSVELTESEYRQIPSGLFPGTLILSAPTTASGNTLDSEVVNAATFTVTSTVAATNPPTKVEFDALRADFLNLKARLLAISVGT